MSEENKYGHNNLIDKESFTTPDMGDFVSKRTLIELGGESAESDSATSNSHMYIDKPFTTVTGYHANENVIIFKATPNFIGASNVEDMRFKGKFDGDTIYADLSTFTDTLESFSTMGSNSVFKSVKDYLIKTVNIDTLQVENPGVNNADAKAQDLNVGIRFLGINAPEIPKFANIPVETPKRQRLEVALKDFYGKGKLSIKTGHIFGTDPKLLLSTKEIPESQINYLKGNILNADMSEFGARDMNVKRVFVVESVTDGYTGKKSLQANEILIPTSSKDNSDVPMSFDDYANSLPPSTMFNGLIEDESSVKMLTGCAGELNDLEYMRQGKKCQRLVESKIKNATEVLYMADCTVLNKKSGSVPPIYRSTGNKIGDNPMYILEAIWKQVSGVEAAYKYLGYTYFGQDTYKRLLGAIYIKEASGLWINLAKYIATECSLVELLPSFTSSGASDEDYGYISNAFELWTYKRDGEFIDMSTSEDYKKTDDRATIQAEITGVSLETLSEHTLMIGDCLLMIPPTSIRMISQTTSNRASFIRTKGSLTKSVPKSERILEIEMYFNEEGINGTPYVQKLPNGTDTTYYMNGLRALVSQFKFAPYLPVHNKYINETLNIEAVAMSSYSINSVPNFPRTYQVTIQLSEFNYSHYMPELAPVDATVKQDLFTNMFSKTIHYPLLRFYYQRAIQKGEELVGLDVNSQDYMDKTIGQQTSLEPMKFQKPTMKLFVANEEHLRMKKQVKIELQKRPLETVAKFGGEEEIFLAELVKEYTKVAGTLESFKTMFDSVYDLNAEFTLPDEKYIGANNNNKLMITSFHPFSSFYDKYWTGHKDYPDYKTDAPFFSIPGTLHEEQMFKDTVVKMKKSINSLFAGDDKVDSTVITAMEFATNHTKVSGGFGKKEIVKVQWGILISPNWSKAGVSVSGLIGKLKSMLAKEEAIKVDDILKDEKIFIALTCNAVGNNNNHLYVSDKFTMDKSASPDVKLMANIIAKFGGVPDGFEVPPDMFNPSEDVNDMQDNNDIETSRSLVFDEYPIGFPIITSVSTAYNNKFANIGLKAIDGKAPQFLGGTDTTINIEMIATDEFTVSQLQTLNRACIQRLIEFRKVLNSSPVRIDMEFTRFLGISEVLIESVDISTVPNMPGTWSISMSLVSVDRTIRNKEALKKVHGTNTSETPNMSASKRTNGYFGLEEALKKVELYPDLELPTIEELSMAGFEFLMYKQSGGRIYPDPDFYFLYLQVFASELYRTAIVKYFKDDHLENTVTEYNGNLSKDSAFSCSNPDKLRGDIKGRGEYFSYAMGEGNEESEHVNKIYEAAGYSYDEKVKTDDGKENKHKTNILNEAVNIKQSETALREIMGAITGSSYSVFPSVRISTREEIPFGQAVEGLIGPGHINTYQIDDKGHANDNFIYKQVNSVEDGYNNTLIALIRSALAEPITGGEIGFLPSNGIGSVGLGLPSMNAKAQKVFTYIYEEIFKNEEGQAPSAISSFTMVQSIMTARVAKRSYDQNVLKLLSEEQVVPIDCVPVGAIKVDGKFIPRIYKTESKQDLVGKVLAETDADRLLGVEFGAAGIEKHSSAYISAYYGKRYVSDKKGFIDPYFNKQLSKSILNIEITEEEEAKRIKDYISGISDIEHTGYLEEAMKTGKAIETFMTRVENTTASKHKEYLYNAVVRETLCFMYSSLVSGNGNIISTAMILVGEAEKIVEELTKKPASEIYAGMTSSKGSYLAESVSNMLMNFFKSDEAELTEDREKVLKETLKTIKKSIGEFKKQLMDGLYVTLGAGVIDKSLEIKSILDDGNIGALAGWFNKFDNIMMSNGTVTGGDVVNFRYYAYMSRLCGNDLPAHSVDEANAKFNENSRYQRLYVAAAEDEKLWIMHSFYNMIVHSKRGTMARAFPTYYMLLIDEGREFGAWHLQDNFYDISAISEFQVVRSRKIAADTAKIVMSNMFGTFTTDDENIKAVQTHSIRDVFDSVFSPHPYFVDQFNKREDAPELNRANLKAGARIHLRSGYSGDASSLPILFNGVVAEIEPGDMMTIMCQGDGVELDNPSMFIASDAKDAADLSQSDNFFSSITKLFNNLSTPKEMLIGPLVSTGGFWRSLTKDITNSRLFNENPFGIVHFGDVRFNQLHPMGEGEQNIYEGQAYPTWSSGGDDRSIVNEYEMLEAPRVKVPIHTGSTYWNLMHTAASVSPDFIASIDNFGLRSSVFFGQPRYYAAYEYEKTPNGNIIEKRKPFQQYHIITSYSDIIANGMKASQKHIRTVAIGHYGGAGVLFGTTPKTVGPLYTDID